MLFGQVAGDTYYAGIRPRGVHGINKLLPHTPYKDGGKDMTLTYWRPGHWFSIMYNMSGPMDEASGDIEFGTGGFQARPRLLTSFLERLLTSFLGRRARRVTLPARSGSSRTSWRSLTHP